MIPYGLGHGVASVVNAEFGLRLLEVAANSFSTQFKKIRGFSDWVPDRQQSQHGKFTCSQRRALTDPAHLRSDKFLQTHGSKRRPHE